MANIKSIIANYQRQMTAAGLLRQAGAIQLSPQVAAMRPSLTKVNRALIENPDLLRQGVQSSPIQILFEYTLPKLEPVLIELGEERAGQIIEQLCEYGKRLTLQQRYERVGWELGLFKDIVNHVPELPDCDLKLMMALWNPWRGMKDYFDISGCVQGYVIGVNGEISKLRIDTGFFDYEGNEDAWECLTNVKVLYLTTNSRHSYIASYFDKGEALYLRPQSEACPPSTYYIGGEYEYENLKVLELSGIGLSDDGLSSVKDITTLEYLNISKNSITDEGLKWLQNLKNLKVLLLGDNRITNSGLNHLRGFKNLRVLGVFKSGIDEVAGDYLKREIPGLKIVTDENKSSLDEYVDEKYK